MPVAHVNGTDLHYSDAGLAHARDTVLLLHAFPLHSGMWASQIAALERRHRVVAPDYRGLGRTPPSGEPSTMELLAEDVRALLLHLRIERAAVVGLSMGGYVALELFRRQPGLFRGLALCDTRAGADGEEGKASRETFARTALERGLGWVADEMAPKLLRDGAGAAELKHVKDLVRGGTPAGVAAAQRGMAARPDSTPTLGAIHCPVRVIHGELDRLIPLSEAERMAGAIPGAVLDRIPGAGHLPNLEAPEAFLRALEGLLDGLPA
jgi:pimeloyl-ACP methyl ester carboxylesterase